jgi:hypothetical protein
MQRRIFLNFLGKLFKKLFTPAEDEELCVHVPDQQCAKAPVEICNDVQECTPVPVKRCKSKPVQSCWTVPVQQCKTVPRQECVQVPKQLCKQVLPILTLLVWQFLSFRLLGTLVALLLVFSTVYSCNGNEF